MKSETQFRDVLALNIWFNLRSKIGWLAIVISGLLVSFLTTFSAIPNKQPFWLVAMMLIAGFGLGVLLVILVSIPLMLLVSVSNLFIRGAIGTKHFSINEEFFTEDDGHKVTSIKWKDIKGIWKTGRYVFVKIKRYKYSIIPRRSFGNEYEFVSFYATLIKFHEGAHNNSLQPTGYAGG